MTQIIQSVTEWQKLRQNNIFQHKKVGFVPTMGNLHAGHLSLFQRSVLENHLTVLSIFVNPTQFDNANDLEKYPQTLVQDIQLAQENHVDFILMPEYSALYPDGYRYKLTENGLSQILCGKYRPGHFDGVLTIVLKLLQLVQPTYAYFGEKDYQQLLLIKAMVEDFFLASEIIACPTIRDSNGLALSSRNNRLTKEEYKLAIHFPRLLQANLSCTEITKQLEKLSFKVDYIEEHYGRRFGAVHVGEIRLIDNVSLSLI